jgi:formylglycine-generating enzyme required for sulfatase activity
LSFKIVVSDTAGTRRLEAHELPLHIGTGKDADVRIPGAVSSREIAQVGLLDGRAFLQVPRTGNVTINGAAVTSTSWLGNDDAIRVAGVAIRVTVAASELRIEVAVTDIDYETTHPDKPEFGAKVKTAGSGSGMNVIYAALSVLLLAAFYMFTAVTVVIEAEDGESVVSLPGQWFTPGWDGRYLLWPGQYDVLVEVTGYMPLQETIEVMAGDRQVFAFALLEKPGRLQITTRPEGVAGEVRIDGQPAGVLPAEEISLPRGNYELRIRTPRFLEYIAEIEIAGKDKLQPVIVELVPGWAEVNVNTNPEGAEISSDGQLLGTSPVTLELLAGTRELLIRKQGFRTEQRTLSVVAGQQEDLPQINLQAAGGLIQLSSKPTNAAVTLDGQFAGRTPVELEVAKGRDYQLRLTSPGHNTTTRIVQVPDGVPVAVAVALPPKLGRVQIEAEPADAVLYVDGKLLGTATRELELLAVPHKLEVRKPGYESWVTQLTPKPGLPQAFSIRLLTPEQAVIAAIPTMLTTHSGQTLKLIGPGEFMLGAPRREQGRRPNEVRRPVKLTRWFYIGLEEVSNKEFREFRPQHTSGAQKYRELAADNSPVVMVSWQEAAAYCNWLSVREGLEPIYKSQNGRLVMAEQPGDGYRLPTEAEWAWVARYNAGSGERKYPWGSGMPPPAQSGNFADMAAEDVASNTIAGFNDGYPVTAPGAAFSPSPLGIYDLGGNVAEWVNDRYTVAGGNGATLIDPLGPTEGQYHVIRGSGWRHSSISELRLAYRDFGELGRLDVGFRLGRYVSEPKQ